MYCYGYRILTSCVILSCCLPALIAAAAQKSLPGDLPQNLRVVLQNTTPLEHPRGGRLPLLVLPISGTLAKLDTQPAEHVLRELNRRGIGYTVDWDPDNFDSTLTEGLRIAAIQQRLDLLVAVNANACLYSFFDGSDQTLHIDSSGQHFADATFGPKLGCPFALQHRIPVMKERVEKFLREYREAGVHVDFVFADWEIDGPIEWNGAWEHSKRCARCRDHLPRIDDFRQFQSQLRKLRSEMQRVVFGDNVTAYFPEALVGNYAVYPHNGYRYWYDYFEQDADGVPYVADQKARYREWYPEFESTGYTFAMPVVYTWYRTFDWYGFSKLDYRWFYNMLLVGSNAGRHTPRTTPIVPFVHWTTTAPPTNRDPNVKQFSAQKYKELLWHLLLRGHDTFFLWCLTGELSTEIRLVHEVYAESLTQRGFLNRGTPITFDVPEQPGSIVSGLRLGNRVLVRRTDFDERESPVEISLNSCEQIVVPRADGNQIVDVQTRSNAKGFLSLEGRPTFPIGFYELPADDTELRRMAAAGVNLVRCGDRKDLDRAQAAGIQGWMPLSVQTGATPQLRDKILSVVDHPALAVWEGPDEIVWTFTAYSQLAKTAGYTRQDWENQIPKAATYAEKQAQTILPNIRAGIDLVRQLDAQNRPFWINEAADSDVRYVRGYVESIDICGCDYYAVRHAGTDLQSVGRLVQRWSAIGRGKPVWMVLQAFSWHSIRLDRKRLYPSFEQSRFMAYDSIVHGARGILYWGSSELMIPRFVNRCTRSRRNSISCSPCLSHRKSK